MATPERWRRISPLLDQALELDGPARAEWMRALADRDAALAAEVRALLDKSAALEREGFMESGPALPDRPSLAGQAFGAYALIEPIGQGGMGSVWLARRSDGRYEGRVAVKLLNASLVGRAGEERFRREGSILARLAHPHIARLIDAGVSASGQPYIVLEHVDGEPIDRFCDARRLNVEARLRLFLDVCAAVALAHANLIVHRDIKPSNVLVDTGGQVKLLDFGIAKLLEADGGSGEATALTREGGQALTPEYAAPEQLTGAPITTATDVYSLGTLLYLLLAGRHPAEGSRSSPALLYKAIVEADPKKPSEATTVPDGAATRATTPEGLRRQLRGDLDTIVAKALKKNPAERYESVGAFAEDVRRCLAHEPIGARPDTLGYRTAKFVRRHRAGVAAGILAAAGVVGGTSAIFWQAREAQRQRDSAQAQLNRATATNEFLSFLLSAAAPAGRKFVVSDLLEQGEAVADKQFPGDDPVRAELLSTIGRQYINAERWEKAIPVLERSEAIARRSNDPAIRARARCPLALAYVATGNRSKADSLIARALADLPDDPQHALQRADCLTLRSSFGYLSDAGEPMIRDATAALAALDRAPVSSRLARIDAETSLAYGFYLTRQNAKADRTYADLMHALEQTGRDRTLAAADVLNNWGLVHYLGDIRKAEPLYRRSLELHRSIEGADAVGPVILSNYAGVLETLGRFEEAATLYQETMRSAHERNDPRVEMDAALCLADTYAESGRVQEAAATLAAIEPRVTDKLFVPVRRAHLHSALGLLALARKDAARARTEYAESVRLFEKVDAKFSFSVLSLIGLAKAELATGHARAAETAARRAIALSETLVEKDAPSYLMGLSQAVLGDAQLAQRQTEASRATLKAALTQLEQTLGPDHPDTRRTRALAGDASGLPQPGAEKP